MVTRRYKQHLTTESMNETDPKARLDTIRKSVSEMRARAFRLFQQGATGVQIAYSLAEDTNALVIEWYEYALNRLPPDEQQLVHEKSAVLAVGGTGRNEPAPYSDLDLMFLSAGDAEYAFTNCVSQLVRDCWDAGFQLGHSLFTPRAVIALAKQEPQIATSLINARLVCGSHALFEKFQRKVWRSLIMGRDKRFVDAVIRERDRERNDHGATVLQLEPDVKRSLGGLRDVQLIRWVGFVHYHANEIDTIRLKGGLNRQDTRQLIHAHDFLMKVRHDLHFSANRAQDVLTREHQLRIAEHRKIEGSIGQRPVECFMQEYFQHSANIADISRRFVNRHRSHSVFQWMMKELMTHRSDTIFKISSDEIDVDRRDLDSVTSNLNEMLRLYQTAQLNNVMLSPQLSEKIKSVIPQLSLEIDSQAAFRFMEILQRPARLGELLRSMNRTGLLEVMIPQMSHARCLLQFNQYHSYTVDEHTLQAVEAACELDVNDSAVGEVYRNIEEKGILHLALLLHDLGKGYEEDHSLIGARIAATTAIRLHLTEHQRELLVFLVEQHLTMCHLAFRRDISDPELLLQFSQQVGSPEALQMLYVLSVADLKAVGPGVWTDWKAELLNQLYDGTLMFVSGERQEYQQAKQIVKKKKQVEELLADRQHTDKAADWTSRELNRFPDHYLLATDPEWIAHDLQRMQKLQPGEIHIDHIYDAETETVDYRIITHEQTAIGCFHKIAGALTSQHLDILAAQICTSQTGTVVDCFRVFDNDFAQPTPLERQMEVAEVIRQVLAGEEDIKDLFGRSRRIHNAKQNGPYSNLKTRVVLDNQTSRWATIIDVFSHDCFGLLYAISRKLFELGLSVQRAKIATHFDQILDVFYVTDATGQKIMDPLERSHIKAELKAEIENYTQQQQHSVTQP